MICIWHKFTFFEQAPLQTKTIHRVEIDPLRTQSKKDDNAALKSKKCQRARLTNTVTVSSKSEMCLQRRSSLISNLCLAVWLSGLPLVSVWSESGLCYCFCLSVSLCLMFGFSRSVCLSACQSQSLPYPRNLLSNCVKINSTKNLRYTVHPGCWTNGSSAFC